MEEIVVQDNEQNKRVDAYIAEAKTELSRTTIKRLLDTGDILVNGKKQKASYKPESGDIIQINMPEATETKLIAQDIPVPIIYEDKDIIVVNKPKGMVVHPANGNPDGTLVNAILAMCKESLSGIGGEIRPGIVHRLDKDTSGLLIVAKNDLAHMNMSKQIQDRKVTKKYIALVRGIVPEDEATIDMPIARSQKDRKKMAVTYKNSKEAKTHIKVLKRFYNSNVTLVEATLETGRTHQIRVHMAYVGHPLVGDEVYGKKDPRFKIEGQMLHAKTLGFIHPTKNSYIEFESNLPEYYLEILKKLENKEKGE